MGIQISFNTDELTAADKALIASLIGGSTPTTKATAPKAAAKPTPAPAPEPEVEEEEESEDDLLGGEPTMADAVAKAGELIGDGKADTVKAALASVGAAKVSLLKASDIPAFIAALG